MTDIKQVADAADMIVNGYAFTMHRRISCLEFESSRSGNGIFKRGRCA